MTGQPPATRRLRVVKVGGSLLDWRHLPAALGRWLDHQPPACTVLIAGGGALADAIRHADRVHSLGEAAAHALCIEAMGVTARLLVAILRGRLALATWADAKTAAPRSLPDLVVLDVSTFLAAAESAGELRQPLPHTWDVTSDSISAAVACALAADELVLLKSCDPPASTGSADESLLPSLVKAGYVDPFFPSAVAGFAGRVQFVNLRSLGYDVRGLD